MWRENGTMRGALNLVQPVFSQQNKGSSLPGCSKICFIRFSSSTFSQVASYWCNNRIYAQTGASRQAPFSQCDPWVLEMASKKKQLETLFVSIHKLFFVLFLCSWCQNLKDNISSVAFARKINRMNELTKQLLNMIHWINEPVVDFSSFYANQWLWVSLPFCSN